jgi:predicted RNA-binding protein YlqC (UPF0109 family)
MREVIDVLARALVDDPDAVEVRENARRGDTVYLELLVGPGDMGKVIGRHGRIAAAIRSIASAAAAKQNQRVVLDINS